MIGFGRIVDRDLYKKIQNSKLSKGNSKGALEKKNKDCKSICWNSKIAEHLQAKNISFQYLLVNFIKDISCLQAILFSFFCSPIVHLFAFCLF